jgi:hypothetical protein
MRYVHAKALKLMNNHALWRKYLHFAAESGRLRN